MKLAGRQVATLLADPSRVCGILLYGPDQGLVRDYAVRAVSAVLGEDRGTFRLAVLPREEHGRLRDELASLSLGGGRRVVRVQDAVDTLVAVLEPMSGPSRDTLVIVEAGPLTARSKLRMMAERLSGWAAVSCFPMSGAAVAAEISAALAQEGLTIEADALAFLVDELGSDFARRQSEVEKLALFAAGDGVIDLERATACCAGQLAASIGQAVSAAMLGDPGLTDRLLEHLAREGATGPGLLAVLSLELQRVLKVRALIEQGSTADEACRSIVPPVYPRQAASFLAEVRRWPPARLARLGSAVRAADLSCKRAGSRDFTIAARLLSSIAITAEQDAGLTKTP